ncbi:hypothetical protein ACQKCL_21800 [Stutzerimonas stutzeri]
MSCRKIFLNDLAVRAPQAEEKFNKYRTEQYALLDAILAGDNSVWLDSLFMPPPSFPQVPIAVAQGEIDFNLNYAEECEVHGARLDLYLVKKEVCGFNIIFGGREFAFSHNQGIVVVSCLGEQIAKLPTAGGLFALSLIKLDQANYIWVSGAKSVRLCSLETEWVNKPISISQRLGEVGVLGSQKWSRLCGSFQYPANQRGCCAFSVNSAPLFIRQWEERSRKLWHMSLMLRVCFEGGSLFSDQNAIDGLSQILALASIITFSVHRYSRWRPSAGPTKNEGEWERGNWANGFLLGAYGLSAGILNDCGKLKLDIRDVTSKAIASGAEWLVREDGKEFTKLDFPPVAHWLRRSTNHGVVILSAALVGLREAYRISGLSADSYISRLEDDYWSLFRGSFRDGMYLEGVRYAQFSLQEALSYLIYSYQASGLEWDEYWRYRIPELGRVKEFFEAAAYPGSSQPMVNWGDCPSLPWKQSVLNLLDSVDGRASTIASLLRSSETKVTLTDAWDDEILKTEPLGFATEVLPRNTSDSGAVSTITVDCFRDEVISVRPVIKEEDVLDWRLYILGTKVHLTHNLDHDSNSFFWAAKGRLILGEVPGRAAYRHSGVGVKGVSLEYQQDQFSCFGAELSGSLVNRNYRSAYTILDQSDQHCFVGSIPGSYVFFDGKPLISDFRRGYFVFQGEENILIVASRGRSDGSNSAFLNYVFPSGDDVRLCCVDGCMVAEVGAGVAYVRFLPVLGVQPTYIVKDFVDAPGARIIEAFDSQDTIFASVAICCTSAEVDKISVTANLLNGILQIGITYDGIGYEFKL